MCRVRWSARPPGRPGSSALGDFCPGRPRAQPARTWRSPTLVIGTSTGPTTPWRHNEIRGSASESQLCRRFMASGRLLARGRHNNRRVWSEPTVTSNVGSLVASALCLSVSVRALSHWAEKLAGRPAAFGAAYAIVQLISTVVAGSVAAGLGASQWVVVGALGHYVRRPGPMVSDLCPLGSTPIAQRPRCLLTR